MNTRMLLCLATAVPLLSSAVAQDRPETTPSPERTAPRTPGSADTPAKAGADGPRAPTTEAEFLKMTGTNNRAAAKLAQLAATHSENAKVRTFAQSWLVNNQAGTDTLADINGSLNVKLTDTEDPVSQRTYARLKALHGDQFDRAFLQEMQTVNSTGLSHFEAATGFVSNQKLKSFMEKSLPQLQADTTQLQRLSNPGNENNPATEPQGNAQSQANPQSHPGNNPETAPGTTPPGKPRTSPPATSGANPSGKPGTLPQTPARPGETQPANSPGAPGAPGAPPPGNPDATPRTGTPPASPDNKVQSPGPANLATAPASPKSLRLR